jgi:hypothetical protein
MKIWTLLLLAGVAACSRAPGNNAAAGNDAAAPANESAAAAPAANAGPAQPAMPAGLDCIRNGLSPEERRAVAELAAEQGSREDPRAQPLMRAVDACAAQLSWSQQKRAFAGMYAMSAAGLAGLQEALTGQGIDLGELNQAIESDQPLMAAANAGQLGTAGQEFAQRHAAVLERLMGDRSQDQQLGVQIGQYIGFRALALATANRFGQEP